MPDDFIEVNGAWIEREFHEQNLEEAREYEWTEVDSPVEHQHCLLCQIAITRSTHPRALRSKNDWICPTCFARFL